MEARQIFIPFRKTCVNNN